MGLELFTQHPIIITERSEVMVGKAKISPAGGARLSVGKFSHAPTASPVNGRLMNVGMLLADGPT